MQSLARLAAIAHGTAATLLRDERSLASARDLSAPEHPPRVAARHGPDVVHNAGSPQQSV